MEKCHKIKHQHLKIICIVKTLQELCILAKDVTVRLTASPHKAESLDQYGTD